jgi:hypothetical protein
MFVVLQSVDPASTRGQRSYDKAVGVLAQTIDGYCPICRSKCLLVMPT